MDLTKTSANKSLQKSNRLYTDHLCLATNAISYGGTTTTSDHKRINANFNIKWYKIKFKKQTASLDHSQLQNPAMKLAYYTEKVI